MNHVTLVNNENNGPCAYDVSAWVADFYVTRAVDSASIQGNSKGDNELNSVGYIFLHDIA